MRKAEHDAAVKRLIETLGATTLVNLESIPTMSRARRAIVRKRALDQAWDCTSCGLCEHVGRRDDRGPTFPGTPTAPCDLIVLTLHPRTHDDRYMKIIRHALSTCDYVDVDRVSFVPVVSCVPRDEDGALRVPTQQHRSACEANLYGALHAANSPYVLAIGQPAVKAWRDLRLDQVRGTVGTWQDTWTITAVEHPAVPMREGKVAMKQWYSDVGRAIDLLYGDITTGLGHVCIAPKCTTGAWAWDTDALPWCERHFNVKNRRRPRDFTDIALPLEA